ncbi:MAG: DedA family protein [Candidatus Nanohaloarchaea archaeon]
MIEHELITLIQNHGVLAVVAGALIEEIVVPIPSPVIPMAAGAFLIPPGAGALETFLTAFFVITLPGAVASVVSSYFVYSIAYYGGEPAVRRFGKYLDLEWEEVQAMEEYFGTEREKYLVAAFRAAPVVPLSLVSGAAGLFQMDWKQYGIWSFVGMVPRYLSLSLIGWYFRESFSDIAAGISTTSKLVAATAAASVLIYLGYRQGKKTYRKILIE